jgi:signal transduction histidine kinase
MEDQENRKEAPKSAPIETSTVSSIVSALQAIKELEGLSESEYRWLADHGTDRKLADGTRVFGEGTPPEHLIFILAGEILVHRPSSSPVTVPIGRAGRITGKTPYSRMKAWGAEGRASGLVWLLYVHQDSFQEMLSVIPSMAERIVFLLVDRNREFTKAEEQIARLAALGKLAGNIAHELNNPASAARSSVATYFSQLPASENIKYRIGRLLQSDEQQSAYSAWIALFRETAEVYFQTSSSSSSMLLNNSEEVLLEWLESENVEEAWNIASILADAGVDLATLEQLKQVVGPVVVPLAAQDLANVVRGVRVATAVSSATGRIFNLVAAVKDYSSMDSVPIQNVDIVESLENVLALLQPRLTSVTVERRFAPDLPTIKAFGSELQQAWHALIENALDSLHDKGTLVLSTKLIDDAIVVEIWDDGPGVAPGDTSRIFEPFFTTKPFGKGLGLGLDTVQRVANRHFGSVSYESAPSATCFQVRIPMDRTRVY